MSKKISRITIVLSLHKRDFNNVINTNKIIRLFKLFGEKYNFTTFQRGEYIMFFEFEERGEPIITGETVNVIIKSVEKIPFGKIPPHEQEYLYNFCDDETIECNAPVLIIDVEKI